MDKIDYLDILPKIKNKTRKEIVIFLFSEPRSYSQLISHTRLKPGSLYHHLKVLDPLVEKKESGLYSLTSLGRTLAEEQGLINFMNIQQKAHVSRISTESTTDESGQPVDYSKFWESGMGLFWGLIILAVSILLGISGVAFAGSALYRVKFPFSFYYDLSAFVIGFVILLMSELFMLRFPQESLRVPVLTVRIISMVPGALMGVSVYVLYLQNIYLNLLAFNIIFTITVFSGLIVSAISIKYFQGFEFRTSLFLATPMILSDLLIGVVVLLS